MNVRKLLRLLFVTPPNKDALDAEKALSDQVWRDTHHTADLSASRVDDLIQMGVDSAEANEEPRSD